MAFVYKKVLMIGATSGIGQALADRMVANGHFVIAVGRRKDRLEDFVQRHGKNKSDFAVFDITKLDRIPDFASDITSRHSDIDCVFLNSGIQRGTNFAKPSTIDMEVISEEFMTNYLSYIALTKAFLPHLQALSEKGTKTSIVYTTSGLALVPISRCLNYCATKAALHHAILCIRAQLAKAGYRDIKIVELMPPAVQTELHDERHQPDIKNGRSMGMPLDQFTDEAWSGLRAGHEQISIGGFAENSADAWEQERQKIFRGMIEHAPDSLVFGGKQ